MTDRTARGRWLRPLALAWSALLAPPLLLPYVDLSFSSVLPVVQALWPLSALVAAVTLLACLGLRQWLAAGVAAAALVVGLLPGVLAGSGSGADPARGGETLTVLAANVAPDWRAELEGLDSWVDDVPADTALVLAGDFNAGRSHPAFREVAEGFTIAPGFGSRTWPEDGRLGPFVDIDHVLARGLAPREAGSAPVDGSDHRAVWAELALEGAD